MQGRAVGRRSELDDGDEALSYRAALLGAAGGVVALCWFGVACGLPPGMAVVYFAIFFLIAFSKIFAVPGPLAFPDGQAFGVAPRVREASYNYPTVDQDTDFGTLHYGGFLDPLYQDAREFVFGASLVLTAEDGTQMGFNPGYLVVAPPDSLPDVIEPELTPVRHPRIQGKDAFAPQSGVGLTPTLSWKEPRRGKPSSYVVQINMISAPASDDTVIAIQARVYKATSFAVPPGLLVPGKTYNASITAIQTDEDENRPFRAGLPIIQVDAMTNTFTP